LQQSGVQRLSDEALLTLVLRTGSGDERLVERVQTLFARSSLQELLRADFGTLCQEYGLGEAKAAQVQALLELARRLTIPPPTRRYQIIRSADAANLVMSEMAFLDHEEMRVLVLDTKSQVVANQLLYQGTVDSSTCRVSELFRPAITRRCPGIIVCHNHPSGNIEASEADIELTKQWVVAGKFLEVELVDHLIIGNHCFTSLRDQLRW